MTPVHNHMYISKLILSTDGCEVCVFNFIKNVYLLDNFSDSAIGEDFDDDGRSHKRAGGGKDK